MTDRTTLVRAGKALARTALFYVLTALLFSIAVFVFPGLLPSDGSAVSAIGLQGLALAAAALGATLILTRTEGAATVPGWPPAWTAARGWLGGTLMGGLMAAITVLVPVAFGVASLRSAPGELRDVAGLLLVLVPALLLAALAEELLFRGYPLDQLSRALGRLAAALALAVAFSLLHAGNPDVSFLGFVNIGLASLLLAAAWFTRGGLAAAWGLHFGWNGGLAGFDAPVSGLGVGMPMFDLAPGGPRWLTGGSFGPEGGVIASATMLAALFLIRRMVRKADRHGE